MQSILSTSPAQASLQEMQPNDNEVAANNSIETEAGVLDFAQVLESFTEDKANDQVGVTSDTNIISADDLNEENLIVNLAEVDSLDEQGIQEELINAGDINRYIESTPNNDVNRYIETAPSEDELASKESELQTLDTVKPPLEVAIKTEINLRKDASQTDALQVLGAQEQPSREAQESQLNADIEALEQSLVNPILAQIEAAKKIDTNVTGANKNVNLESVDLAIKAPDHLSAQAAKLISTNSVNDLSIVDGVLTDDVALEAEGAIGSDVVNTNKLDTMISSLKSQSEVVPLSTGADSSELTPVPQSTSAIDKVNSASAAKAPNITPHMQASAELDLPLELQSKNASTQLGEKIKMMINQGKQEVTIRLDPAELGSMQIKLHVQQDQVQVAIQTQVGLSRDIIEQNLPRLREQLEQQGISLGEATVEQQSKQQQSESEHAQGRSGDLHANAGSDSLLEEQSEWISTQIPLPAQGIDYYA